MKPVFFHLWGLFDHHFQQDKVVEFVLLFQQGFPEIFKEIIENSLKVEPDEGLDNCIRKYASFRLKTNDYYKENSIYYQGVAIEIMLHFLEHNNSFIKLLSKSWLTES